MREKIRIALGPVFLSIFFASPAVCATISSRVCLSDLVDRDIFKPEIPPIIVGCEAIDCCKGCPGPPFKIEWQVTVEGDGVAGAVFEFDKLERSAPSGLQARSGSGVKVDRKGFVIERGKSAISGFVTDGKRAKGAIAGVSLRLKREAVAAMLKMARSRHRDKDEGEDNSEDPVGVARIRVDQMVGATVVSQLVLEVEFALCGRPGTPSANCPQPEWESIGPDHISGAMKEIVIDPKNHHRLYAVSANGGIWRLDDVRAYPDEQWHPLTDGLSGQTNSQNVPLTPGVNHLRFRTMAVAPSAPNIIYSANSVKELLSTPATVYSELYRTRNGGFSWTAIHASSLGVINHILVHPANPDVVYLATSTGFWKQAGTVGTWTQLRTDDCVDAELDPDDSSIIYVAVRGQGVFKSFTSGSDWSVNPIIAFNASLTDGCLTPPQTVANRSFIELALGRRNADTDHTPQTPLTRTVVVRMGVEICVNNAGGEGGDSTWQRTIPCRLQGTPPANDFLVRLDGGSSARSDDNPRQPAEWSNCLEVDPFNPNHILVGSDGLLESTDGGLTWTRRTGLHEDQHGLAFDTVTENLVYLANDGGLFSSINGGTSWPDMSLAHTTPASNRGLNLAKGLVTSELRHSVVQSGRCVAAIDHTGFVLSEAFDKRWQFLFDSPDAHNRHAHESSLIFGSPTSLDRYYVINIRSTDDPLSTPGAGVIGRLAQWDFTRTNSLVDAPAFQFISTETASLPANSGYFPETMIYQLNVHGPFAASVNGNSRRLLLGANAAPPATGFILRSFLLPATGATASSTAVETTSTQPFFAMTFVPNNPDRVFAMTAVGQLFERDFSTSTAAAPLGAPWAIPTGDRFVSRLVAVAQPTLTLYALSQHGLARFDFAKGEWAAEPVWPQVNETLMSLAVQPGKPSTLFLGTSQGVYIKQGTEEWKPFQLHLPRVPVSELTFDEGHLYAATLGRGLWRCKPCP